jgi:hypothetical protein
VGGAAPGGDFGLVGDVEDALSDEEDLEGGDGLCGVEVEGGVEFAE